MQNIRLVIAALVGFLAVAIGAFGAHALGFEHGSKWKSIYNTGAQYQLAHAVVLLCLALAIQAIANEKQVKCLKRGFGFILIGLVLFSGSLYALASLENRSLGMITPFGGLLLLVGWGNILWAGALSKED